MILNFQLIRKGDLKLYADAREVRVGEGKVEEVDCDFVVSFPLGAQHCIEADLYGWNDRVRIQREFLHEGAQKLGDQEAIRVVRYIVD